MLVHNEKTDRPCARLLQRPPSRQQPRIIFDSTRRIRTTITPCASRRIPDTPRFPFSTQPKRNSSVKPALDFTQVLVQHPQRNDHEEGEDEAGVRRDVPFAEDDTCVDYLGVPAS